VNAHAQFHIDGHRVAAQVGTGQEQALAVGDGTFGVHQTLVSGVVPQAGSRPANSYSVAAADSRAIAASEGVTLGASARQTSTRSPVKARCLGLTTAWAASRDLLIALGVNPGSDRIPLYSRIQAPSLVARTQISETASTTSRATAQTITGGTTPDPPGTLDRQQTGDPTTGSPAQIAWGRERLFITRAPRFFATERRCTASASPARPRSVKVRGTVFARREATPAMAPGGRTKAPSWKNAAMYR